MQRGLKWNFCLQQKVSFFKRERNHLHSFVRCFVCSVDMTIVEVPSVCQFCISHVGIVALWRVPRVVASCPWQIWEWGIFLKGDRNDWFVPEVQWISNFNSQTQPEAFVYLTSCEGCKKEIQWPSDDNIVEKVCVKGDQHNGVTNTWNRSQLDVSWNPETLKRLWSSKWTSGFCWTMQKTNGKTWQWFYFANITGTV